MKKYLLSVVVSFFSVVGISAESQEFDMAKISMPNIKLAGTNAQSTLPAEHPCIKVNLTESQINAIKEIVYQNSRLRAQDEANLKKAMIEVEHRMSSSTSTKEQAERAQSELQAAISALAKTAAQLDLSINYDVLHADQREMGSLCSKIIYSYPAVSNAFAFKSTDP